MKRVVAVAMMVMSAGAAAQINKCVDKSGKVVGYGYECQPGTTPQASGVKAAPPPPAAPAAAASPGGASPAAPKSTAERDADFRKRQMEKQEASAKDDKKAAAAAQNQRACEESRAYLKSLQSGNRITRTDPKTGERVFLGDTDYSAEIARTQKTLDTHCK
jgi:type IV secretory pathway VirB10-like protein